MHQILSLKSNKAIGDDMISGKELRSGGKSVMPGLKGIFMKSFETGKFFFIQYKNFTKTNYLRLHLQTTGLHNKDDDPGKQEPMTIPKGHYIKH